MKGFTAGVNKAEGDRVLVRKPIQEKIYGGELTDAEKDVIIKTEGGLTITKSQFGKKVGKHAVEFGLDPADKSSRDKVLDIITDIHDNPDFTAEGLWRGQGELNENGTGRKSGKVTFSVKGTAVVSKDNKFITVMQNGLTNGNVKKAIENRGKETEKNDK